MAARVAAVYDWNPFDRLKPTAMDPIISKPELMSAIRMTRFVARAAPVAILALSCALALPALAAKVGEAAPAFALPDAAGKPLTLDAYRGKVVYLDFWASWCGPCRRAFPWMNEMLSKYGDRGLVIVAINVDKKRADADRFLQQNPARFDIVYDHQGVAPAAYAVKGMPTSYLLDAQGKVIAVEEGFHDDNRVDLEERIRAALAK